MLTNLADPPLLFIFRSLRFHMNSAINARNATIIPTPSITYTPNMLIRSIRFGYNTEKLTKDLVTFRDNIFRTNLSIKSSELKTGKMVIENVGMTPQYGITTPRNLYALQTCGVFDYHGQRLIPFKLFSYLSLAPGDTQFWFSTISSPSFQEIYSRVDVK